ncbi:hypothetical protein B0H14DRAFT_2571090 [Mycena olivaceomarginata]|nr:hypothetical protein B0H14DRAFT_2571090 [Mycena olivaceomarginata]
MFIDRSIIDYRRDSESFLLLSSLTASAFPMVLVSVSSTDYVIGYAILSIVTVSFMPAPGLIKYYYPDSKLPTFAVACLRIKDITGSAFTTASFCTAIVMISTLLNDARQWITRTRRVNPSSTPGHIALGDGTATPPTSQSGPISSLVCLVSNAAFFTQQMFIEDVVSLKQPLRENIGSALLYLLCGLRLLIPAGLVFLFVVWRKNRRAAVEDSAAPSAASPRVEILQEKGEPVDVALVK